jgi:ATP-dependent HslUV protease ATP-binding subunit HslU
VLERVFEELSFAAPDRGGETVVVDRAYVDGRLAGLAQSADLSRYVL